MGGKGEKEKDKRDSPLTKTRQVGKPNKLGVPSQEEMQKDREAALQAASIIAGNGNGNLKNGTKLLTETVNAPEFVPRRNGKQRGVGEKAVTSQPQPPPYYMVKESFCENCQGSHVGHSCLCPICGQGGHWYYECPQRDLKEGMHKTPEDIQFLQGPLCQICHLNHELPCTIGLKQHKQVQEAFSQRRDGECGELARIKPQGPTPFCMYCGQMKGRHGPECPLYESNGPKFSEACTFCGYYGHQADNCEARHREYQTQMQSGHLCSYCGSQNHMFMNCEKYKVILARQKQEIGQRNADRYMTAVQAAGGKTTQQTHSKGTTVTPSKQRTTSNSQERTGTNTGGGTAGMGGGGDEPPRKPPKIKPEPLSAFEEQNEEEEVDEAEDSDKTEIISMSSTHSSAKVIGKDGKEMSLGQFLKARRKYKRRTKKRRDKGDDGGGSSPSSSRVSDGEESSEFEIAVIRGKHGYRGQRGRTGPPGPPGPTIEVPFLQWPTAQAAKPPEPNIMLNSRGMEESFKGLSDSLNRIFAQQDTLNQTLQGHVTLGIQAQDEQAQAL